MLNMKAFVLVILSFLGSSLLCQIKSTSVPIGDAAAKALDSGLLTSKEAKPFHEHIVISEPENPQSPYQGSIEEWWTSASQWRRVVKSKDGMQQTIVVTGGKRTESDQGDYFPLWLRNFVTAAFDPIPNADAWMASGITIDQVTMPNGAKSDACARVKLKIGTGDRATDAFTNLCFDGEGRLQFYGSPRYSMEFHDYSRFSKKQIARRLVSDPEPGTKLVGQVDVLEELKGDQSAALFTSLSTNDNVFTSISISSNQMESLSATNPPVIWPVIRSGNKQGHLAMYVSVDREGHIREAWPLNSDNAGLQDPARDQVRRWVMKAAVDASGNYIQVDGGLGFTFSAEAGVPLPQLSNQEVRDLATTVEEPVWAPGSVHPGDVIEVEVSVDEQGKLAGLGFTKTLNAAQGAVMNAMDHWKFRPLIRDGKPLYFHGTVRFTVQ